MTSKRSFHQLLEEEAVEVLRGDRILFHHSVKENHIGPRQDHRGVEARKRKDTSGYHCPASRRRFECQRPYSKSRAKEAKQHYPGRATPLVAGDETTLGKTADEEVVPQDRSAKETWTTHARRQKEAVRSDEKALGGKEGKSFLSRLDRCAILTIAACDASQSCKEYRRT